MIDVRGPRVHCRSCHVERLIEDFGDASDCVQTGDTSASMLFLNLTRGHRISFTQARRAVSHVPHLERCNCYDSAERQRIPFAFQIVIMGLGGSGTSVTVTRTSKPFDSPTSERLRSLCAIAISVMAALDVALVVQLNGAISRFDVGYNLWKPEPE